MKIKFNIAIILYGITRGNAKKTYSKFNELILKPLQLNFSTSVFLHAIEMNKCIVDTRRNLDIINIKDPKDWKHYSPDFYISDKDEELFKSINYNSLFLNSRDPFNNGMSSMRNYLNALKSLHKSFSQSLHKKYDCYFISRLDLLYKNNTNIIESCFDVCSNPDSNILYTPNWNRSKGLNDRIAIGNFLVSKEYCGRFQNYNTLRDQNKRNIHPEQMLLKMSQVNNFINKNFKCYASRLRSNGHEERN